LPFGVSEDPRTKLVLINGGRKTRNNSAAVAPANVQRPAVRKIETQQSLAIAPFFATLLFNDMFVPTNSEDRRTRFVPVIRGLRFDTSNFESDKYSNLRILFKTSLCVSK